MDQGRRIERDRLEFWTGRPRTTCGEKTGASWGSIVVYVGMFFLESALWVSFVAHVLGTTFEMHCARMLLGRKLDAA